ncbi:MAG: polysaccharide deacetylase family protein [bacterium]
MINLLTFDIEDWYHPNLAVLDDSETAELESRVVEPTLRIINMLDQTKNKATFFVLGQVAEKFPELLHEITHHGHEVASHGYRHNLVYSYTKFQFETDLRRSVELLEGVTQEPVMGYRAPSWSLGKDTPWAWEVLHAQGFQYDSSLYPYRTFLYGDNTSPRFDYEIEIASGEGMKEIPPSALEKFGKRWPFAGGFFLRVAPLWYVEMCIKDYNRFGKPAVIYLHPWEIDVEQPRLPLRLKDRFIMYANIRKTEKKLATLLEKYTFTSIRDYFSLGNGSRTRRSEEVANQEMS